MRVGGAGGQNQCPGEEVCTRFQSAAGANRAQKELEACTGCELFPTKFKEVEREGGDLSAIERFIQERRAGFKPNENQLSPLQFEGVLIWDSVERQYELAFQNSMMQMLGMFGAKK